MYVNEISDPTIKSAYDRAKEENCVSKCLVLLLLVMIVETDEGEMWPKAKVLLKKTIIGNCFQCFVLLFIVCIYDILFLWSFHIERVAIKPKKSVCSRKTGIFVKATHV